MHIHEGSLFWPTTMPFAPKRKTPEKAEHYDAIIVGGGMSGALSALALADKGMNVAILDKRQMATGSTMANTGLLQYSNDIMLHELIEQIGEKDAVRFYQLCFEAMKDLNKTADRLPINADFICRPSIYYASDERDTDRIIKEYQTLNKYGFPCDYWNKEEMRKKLPFSKPGAILTYADAEVNPYKFVNGLLQLLESQGVQLFEFTEVNDAIEENGTLRILTSAGEFLSDKVLFTTGYETLPIGKRIGADINRSYVMVTKPLNCSQVWHENALIWESKRPYLYMRTTVDHRIVIGGLDEKKPEAPLSDELIMQRGAQLKGQLLTLFPNLTVDIDYAYCATFGESIDNLPFIGEHPTKKNHYYLLGYGGNGTVYSMLGSKIIATLMAGIDHPHAHIVELDRHHYARAEGHTVIA